MRIIDGTGLIFGRVASYAAKKALEGEKISIVNADKLIITGNKAQILADFKEKRERGSPHWGPYYPRMSDRILKRTIRGMLQYKRERGEIALKNIMCYRGVPVDMKDQKFETIKNASYTKLKMLKYIELGKIAHLLGGK